VIDLIFKGDPLRGWTIFVFNWLFLWAEKVNLFLVYLTIKKYDFLLKV